MKLKLRILALAATLAVSTMGLAACKIGGDSSAESESDKNVIRPDGDGGSGNSTGENTSQGSGSTNENTSQGSGSTDGSDSGAETPPDPQHNHHFKAEMTGAPCDPNGYVIYSCECGAQFVIDNYLPHTYVNGKCIYCGQTNYHSFSGHTGSSAIGNIEGNPLGSVHVILTDDASNFYDTYSDEDGAYFFESLPAGLYHVRYEATDENYDDVVFDLTLDEDLVRDVYFDYRQDSILTGKVTVADSDLDYSNNAPLVGATVTLTKSSGTNELVVSMETTEDGTYRFENLPAGAYRMEVSQEGYLSLVQNINIARGVINVQNVILELIENHPDITTGGASGMIYDAARQGNVGIPGLTLHVRGGLNNLTGEALLTLHTDEGGNYTIEEFPAGNYTVEIVDERELENEDLRFSTGSFNIKILAGEMIANQNGSTTNGETRGQLRIKLQWGSTPADLDSHLTGPTSGSSRFHIYYEAKTYSNGAAEVMLDRDDTDSYGPETTTIYVENEGVYRFSVHDYTNRNSSYSSSLANSNATVEVYFGDVLYYTFNAPAEAGTLWTVFEYDSTTRQIKEINSMSYQSSPSSVI